MASSSSSRRASHCDMDRSEDVEPGSSSSGSGSSVKSVRIEDIRAQRAAVEALQVSLNAATMSDDPNASASVAKELTLQNRKLRQLEASFAEQERRTHEITKLKENIQIGIMNTKMTTEDRRREMMELGGGLYRQISGAGLSGDAMTAIRKKVKRLQLLVEQDVLNTDRVPVGTGDLPDDDTATFRAMRKDCVQALQGLERWLDTLDRHLGQIEDTTLFLSSPYAGHRSDPSLTPHMNAAAATAAAAAATAAPPPPPHSSNNGIHASPAPHARTAHSNGAASTPSAAPSSSSSSSTTGRSSTPPLHQTPTSTRHPPHPPHSSSSSNLHTHHPHHR